MFSRPCLLISIFVFAPQPSAGAEDVLEPGSKPVKVVEGCKFTEGPVFNSAGDLLFSDGAKLSKDRFIRTMSLPPNIS